MNAADSPPHFRWRRWRLPLLAALVLIGTGAAIYIRWATRPKPVEIPSIVTDGMDEQVAKAIERTRAEVVADPQSADKWGKVGLLLYANDILGECRPWLEQAERLDPRDVRWPYFRGMVLLRTNPDDAIGPLQRAAELAPDDPHVQLRLAETLLTVDRIDEADRAFAAVLRVRPNHSRAMLGRGQVLMRRGDAAAAVPLLERAATSPAAQKAARAALAEARQRLGDESGAAEQRRLAAAAPDDIPWSDPKLAALEDLELNLSSRLRRIESLIASEKFERAFVLLEQTLRDRPDSPEAHLALGYALFRAGREREAEDALQKAIALDPSVAAGHTLLATMRHLRGDAAGAEKHLRKVLELRPDDGLAHYNLALCRLKLDDKNGALAALKEAIRFRPDYADAHRVLGELHLEAGRIAEALISLEAATQLAPQDEKARTLLEQARARRKK